MARVTIFAKGNSDVRDSLVAHHEGGRVVWNGLNEVLRAQYPGVVARVRHETFTRSDALLAAGGAVPDGLAARFTPGAYGLAGQFSVALFDAAADAVVLSIQPDVTMGLARHRETGMLFYPGTPVDWSEAARACLRDSFVDTGLLQPERAMDNMRRIVGRIRARSDAAILIYNLSSVIPGEWVHCHAGLAEGLATRIRRFNLGLVELSRDTGISIVDVDALVAHHGAARIKLDPDRLTAEGSRLVAAEVARILDDLGCLPSDAALTREA